MRKYLGSKITAFAAIISPLFICFPPILGICSLGTEVSGSTIFLMLGGISCAFIWGLYIKSIKYQLYSWGDFFSNGVRIITCFSKSTIMLYEKCMGCGIGWYTHGVLNSKAGTTMYFIYISYDLFDERFRGNINLWKSSRTQIKVQFDAKLYDYLIAVLPEKQKQMLSQDYKKYFLKNKDRGQS